MSEAAASADDPRARRCLDDLVAANASRGIDADARFRRALVALVADREALLGALPPAARAAFLGDLRRALLREHARLQDYLQETRHLALAGDEDGWHGLCLRRSALQFLIDDAEAPAFGEWLRGDALAEVDALMAELGARHGPIPDAERPDGLPAAHAWWWYPDTPEAVSPDDEDGDAGARDSALQLAALFAGQVEPVLRALASGGAEGRRVAEALRPQPQDCARVFTAPLAEAAQRAYTALWAGPPRIEPAAAKARLEIHVAPAGLLAADNALSRYFPGGYRQLAPYLQPSRIWVAWRWIAPGQDSGVAQDGLVWIDDHWAWLPKPCRQLRAAIESLDAAAATDPGSDRHT